jgi:hypothetical protein
MAKPVLKLFGREPKPHLPDAQTGDNTNPLFAPAFRSFLRTSRSALLVFGETDRLLWDFEAKFLERHRGVAEQYGDRYDLHVVKQANHIFSLAEWQEDVLNRSSGWLQSVATGKGHIAAHA